MDDDLAIGDHFIDLFHPIHDIQMLQSAQRNVLTLTDAMCPQVYYQYIAAKAAVEKAGKCRFPLCMAGIAMYPDHGLLALSRIVNRLLLQPIPGGDSQRLVGKLADLRQRIMDLRDGIIPGVFRADHSVGLIDIRSFQQLGK